MVGSLACVACAALAAAAPKPVTVHAPLVLGFTDVQGEQIEVVALVEGRTFRHAAMEMRGTLTGGVASGRFTLFDGRGSLRGRAHAVTMDGSHFEGTFTVGGGTGRYARAAGRLHFSGALDSSSVPGVAVLPGRLDGKLKTHPAAPKPRLEKPLAIDQKGKAAKLRFRQVTTDPFFAKLTSGYATAVRRLGNGVRIEISEVRDSRLRPKVATWYGQDGTWTAKGTTNLDTGPNGSDPLKVTGGTGRYRGARGTLAYTLLTPAATSGLQVVRLRGKLGFR